MCVCVCVCVCVYIYSFKCLVCQKQLAYYFGYCNLWGFVVAQFVEVLRYKPEVHGFDSR